MLETGTFPPLDWFQPDFDRVIMGKYGSNRGDLFSGGHFFLPVNGILVREEKQLTGKGEKLSLLFCDME